MAALLEEIDSSDFGSYSDTNGSSFDNADSNSSIFNSDTLMTGDGTLNTVPLVSDAPQSSVNSPFSGLGNIMGAIGSTIQDLPNIARSAGTAVGTAQHNLQQAQANYNQAYTAASTGNHLSTWWQYASTETKIMIGLSVIGILIALKE